MRLTNGLVLDANWCSPGKVLDALHDMVVYKEPWMLVLEQVWSRCKIGTVLGQVVGGAIFSGAATAATSGAGAKAWITLGKILGSYAGDVLFTSLNTFIDYSSNYNCFLVACEYKCSDDLKAEEVEQKKLYYCREKQVCIWKPVRSAYVKITHKDVYQWTPYLLNNNGSTIKEYKVGIGTLWVVEEQKDDWKYDVLEFSLKHAIEGETNPTIWALVKGSDNESLALQLNATVESVYNLDFHYEEKKMNKCVLLTIKMPLKSGNNTLNVPALFFVPSVN